MREMHRTGVTSRSRILAIKERIIGEFHAFRMKVVPDDANLSTTPLLITRAANRANELHSKVIISHMPVYTHSIQERWSKANVTLWII